MTNSPKKLNPFLKSTPNSSSKNSLKTSLFKSDILKFISSGIKNKLNLNSAFDQTGSKKFLDSKKIALQEISVNDEEISDFSLNKVKSGENIFYTNNYLTPEKISKCRDENTKRSKNKSKNEEGKIKYKIRKPVTDKFLLKCFKIEDIDDNESNKNKDKSKDREKEKEIEKKIRKLSHKSTHELKMLRDKDIKEIEPIQKTKYNKNEKKYYNFVNTEETDLSLFDMVNQL